MSNVKVLPGNDKIVTTDEQIDEAFRGALLYALNNVYDANHVNGLMDGYIKWIYRKEWREIVED
jgi:hypothetical protein